MEDGKPHIEFTMKGDIAATTLAKLGVVDPSISRSAATPHSTWPGKEQWASYLERTSEWRYGLLTDDERHRIEAKLSSLETAFEAWLKSTQASGDAQHGIQELRLLGVEVRGTEKLVCESGSHATLPYFVRWFMLEFAVMSALADRHAATQSEQLAAVQMWWRGRDYLQRAFQSAYTYRVEQIDCRVTGALEDRIYVYDVRADAALTTDVAMGGQDAIEIHRVLAFLSSVAARDYIRDIRFSDGVDVLAQAHAAISVTSRSLIRQDELVDPMNFWQSLQDSVGAEVEANRLTCGSALNRLVIPALQFATEPPTVQSRMMARHDDKPAYWDVIETVVPGLIGMIPVVGSAASIVFTLYFKFIGDTIFTERPDPFIEFEKKMEALIYDKIAESNARQIKNQLSGFDNLIRELGQDYAREKPTLTPYRADELKNRALGLLSQITIFQEEIFNPSSTSYYRIAPYYMHYFITYLFIMDQAKTLGVTTYDFPARRKRLYEATNRFVSEAIHGIARERRDNIRIRNRSNGCNADILDVHDYRTGVTMSNNLSGVGSDVRHYAEVACKEAAGMASAIQLMRSMTREMDGIILRDTVVVNTSPSGFRPETISDTYYQAMWYLNGQVWSGYQNLKQRSLTHLVSPETGPFSDATEAQRRYFETTPPFPTLGNGYFIR